MTSVATRPPQESLQQPALLEPSSQVINSAPPLRNAAEAVIVGTTLRNQPSPVDTAQSCMSLHMLGVIQTRLGTWPLLMSAPYWLNVSTCTSNRVELGLVS